MEMSPNNRQLGLGELTLDQILGHHWWLNRLACLAHAVFVSNRGLHSMRSIEDADNKEIYGDLLECIWLIVFMCVTQVTWARRNVEFFGVSTLVKQFTPAKL